MMTLICHCVSKSLLKTVIFFDQGVGKNLQDHVTTDGVVFVFNKTSTDKPWKKKIADAYKYKEHRKGPLASTGPLQCGVFAQTW